MQISELIDKRTSLFKELLEINEKIRTASCEELGSILNDKVKLGERIYFINGSTYCSGILKELQYVDDESIKCTISHEVRILVWNENHNVSMIRECQLVHSYDKKDIEIITKEQFMEQFDNCMKKFRDELAIDSMSE